MCVQLNFIAKKSNFWIWKKDKSSREKRVINGGKNSYNISLNRDTQFLWLFALSRNQFFKFEAFQAFYCKHEHTSTSSQTKFIINLVIGIPFHRGKLARTLSLQQSSEEEKTKRFG